MPANAPLQTGAEKRAAATRNVQGEVPGKAKMRNTPEARQALAEE